MGWRYYKTVDGRRYGIPGVTTVIGQIGWSTRGLMYWANKAGLQGLNLEEAREVATSVGTRVHELIESDIKREPPPLCDWLTEGQQAQVDSAMSAWYEWCESTHFVVLDVERKLISEKWDVGGRADLVSRVGGKLALVDWKSSKGVYPNTLIQVAAYAELYREATGVEIERVHVVRFGKDDGSFQHHSWSTESLAPALRAFEIALELKPIEKLLKSLSGR